MKQLRNKMNKLQIKREKMIEEKLISVQSLPNINNKKNNIIFKNKKKYIPIYLRPDQFNGRLMTKNALNEIKRQLEIEYEENKVMMEIKSRKPQKKYDEENWNKFVEKQYKWKEEVDIRKKAAELMKYEKIRKQSNKNKMSLRSRNLVKKMIKKNKTMDDVFLRLYNDFEKRGEKKESLISYYMPPFKPTISKYKKFINK
jgi:hypothetical protein